MSILICYDDSESGRRALAVAGEPLGSVSDGLVRRSGRPALIVHAGDRPPA